MLRMAAAKARDDTYDGPRFEYTFTRHGFATGDMIEFNKLGEQGWEYIGPSLDDDKRYIFRRRTA
jgi:hypothetical protein